jgi:hypothetical protein
LGRHCATVAGGKSSADELARSNEPLQQANPPSIMQSIRHSSGAVAFERQLVGPPARTNRVTRTNTVSNMDAEHGEPDPACRMIRHTLATLAYRASKAVRGAPSDFGAFRVGTTTRTPAEILAHMGDLMEWALTMAQDRTQWRSAPVQAWADDVHRLFAGITALDTYLASGMAFEIRVLSELFQGPIADALTHTGQLTMLRRLAEAPIKGENYQRAHIGVGQTGVDQPQPQREFD